MSRPRASLPARMAAIVWAAVLLAGAARAEEAAPSADGAYPTRPIVLVVTFPPGGGTDMLARRLAVHMESALGQPVVVENRAGASGNIGAQMVARSRPDGYTLLMVNSSYAINPGVYRNLGFSPDKDLVGVINIAFVPSVLVTPADSPWKSLPQALEGRSGQQEVPLSYASCGNGTPQHLAGEQLMGRTGGAWLHVPYRGCGPALAGLLAHTVDVGFVTASGALPLIHAGALRALAVTSPRRSPLLPDVPTVAEQGLPGYELDQWHGILAPAGTPEAVIERLNSAIAAIMGKPELIADLQALGYATTASTAQEFQSLIQRDIARFGRLTMKIGLEVN
ncbi:MAG TPA: tripartite tricarboxylate transporter substrate binding protein [Burkholderiaceae bacterium]|nr:tripartite tricarboxylate transporter substrate binding protein [Burkholderiaceae bacterium]